MTDQVSIDVTLTPRRPGLLEGLAGVLSTAALVWVMMPPQERRWVQLAITQQARKLAARADRLARRQGQAGMDAEMRGRRADATMRYGSAWWLSVARDGLSGLVKVITP